MKPPSFDEYLASLSNLALVTDPTALTAEAATILGAAKALNELPAISVDTIATLITNHPEFVPTLGYAVGLSREALKNTLKHHLGTSGWIAMARSSPQSIVAMLEDEYDLMRLLEAQRGKIYEFGDVLVARAGTRLTATHAGQRGRRLEDEIESAARSLGLTCATRTRFLGRGNETGPCDLAIPGSGQEALIVVAAKGFNSTGSKLSDAVGEVERMASIRKPTQFVMAAIDGIGWKSRQADLRRIYNLWSSGSIDGMYSLASLDRFRIDLESFSKRLGLLE